MLSLTIFFYSVSQSFLVNLPQSPDQCLLVELLWFRVLPSLQHSGEAVVHFASSLADVDLNLMKLRRLKSELNAKLVPPGSYDL